MGIIKSSNGLFIVGIAFLLPLVSAARTSSCSGVEPTYPSNYSEQASRLLQDIRGDARQVANQIAELKPFTNNSNASWDFETEKLIGAQSQITDMDNRLCRLKTIEPVVTPAQQKTIQGVESELPSLRANSRGALLHVEARTGQLWSPSYKMETQNAYREANTIAARIEHREQLARLHANQSTLEESPGVTGK
jgi:hypothetical protein